MKRRKGKAAKRSRLVRLGGHVVELRIVSKVQTREVKGRPAKRRRKGKR